MSHIFFLQLLLTPEYRKSLPIVMMILMMQGIHHDVIFQLISSLELTASQFQSLVLASFQMRVFLELTGLFKSHQVLLNRTRKRTYRQTSYVHFFDYFKQNLVKKMLQRLQFCGDLPLIYAEPVFPSLKKLIDFQDSLPPIYRELLSLSISERRLILLKNAVELQKMIVCMREENSVLASFFRRNPNAVFNVVLCWVQQVSSYEMTPQNLFKSSKDFKRTPMDFSMIVILVAVIYPNFLDDVLSRYVNSAGGDYQHKISSDYVELIIALLNSTGTILPDYDCWFNSGDFLGLIQMMSSMRFPDSDYSRIIRMESWSFLFGHIESRGYDIFHTASTNLFRDGFLVLDVLQSFCLAFFSNLRDSFPVLVIIGNHRWEIEKTIFLEESLGSVVINAISQFAYNMGKYDGRTSHTWLKIEMRRRLEHIEMRRWLEDGIDCFTPMSSAGMNHQLTEEITPDLYKSVLFPTPFVTHNDLASFFVYKFWKEHPRLDAMMPDLEYLHWLLDDAEHLSPSPIEFLEILASRRGMGELPEIPDVPEKSIHCDTSKLSNYVPKNTDLQRIFLKHFNNVYRPPGLIYDWKKCLMDKYPFMFVFDWEEK
jgi:hypothetical protein